MISCHPHTPLVEKKDTERSFSCAGRVVTKSRNRLSPTEVEKLVVRKQNFALCEIFKANKSVNI